MFGFPIGNGNAGFNDFVEKFTNNADSGFPKIQQREVFYSVKDGAWNDTSIWQTASGRVGILPTQNDDVYIRNFITTINTSCNNLFIGNAGTLYYTGGNHTISVFGNCINYGIINMAQSTTALILYGTINNLGNVIHNTTGSSTINYSGTLDQAIYGMDYRSLGIGGAGTKYLTSNTLVTQNFSGGSIGLIFEIGGFDLTVNGTTSSNYLSKNGGGNILLIGNAILGGVILHTPCNIEFRGGLTINFNANSFYNFGGNTLIFTTNNQTISGNTSFTPNTPILISGAITLTNTLTSGSGLSCSFAINGDNASSKLTNQGTITFTTQDACQNTMATGIYDFTTTANTIAYSGNYSATIPSYFTNFHNLTISGGGTKTFGVNTTLNGNLLLNGTGILQLSTYNLTVTGTTTLQNGSNQLLKSGSGNVLFIGELIRSSNGTESLDFSVGNPNVELRGGINQFGGVNWLNFKTGTGTWSFTTNNQTIQQNLTINFDCPILIVGAISLTLSTVGSADLNVGLYNTINGTVAGSTLVVGNNTSIYSTNLNLYVNTTFMTTGTVDLTKTSGKVAYLFNGNFTLPYSSYNGLVIGGTGTKSPSSNLTIGQRGLTINSGATFDLLTYNLDNATTTNINNSSNLNKTGSGNVIFGGTVTYTGNTLPSIDFSVGNPTVTVRNGLRFAATANTAFKSGTGVWTFDTNNQSIQSGNATVTFDCPITISGAITLTHSFSSGTFSTLILKGVLNGNNASSNFTNGAGCTINYQNATQPMVTGILDTSTNLNTWIYGSGNQDIKGSPTTSPKQVYRNLTLNGGGVKTLQGYVSVQNTYTLTSPATLALNGFTLTNP